MNARLQDLKGYYCNLAGEGRRTYTLYHSFPRSQPAYPCYCFDHRNLHIIRLLWVQYPRAVFDTSTRHLRDCTEERDPAGARLSQRKQSIRFLLVSSSRLRRRLLAFFILRILRSDHDSMSRVPERIASPDELPTPPRRNPSRLLTLPLSD